MHGYKYISLLTLFIYKKSFYIYKQRNIKEISITSKKSFFRVYHAWNITSLFLNKISIKIQRNIKKYIYKVENYMSIKLKSFAYETHARMDN